MKPSTIAALLSFIFGAVMGTLAVVGLALIEPPLLLAALVYVVTGATAFVGGSAITAAVLSYYGENVDPLDKDIP